jgi:CDGSH-type Zn-finger protein/uncharacterized Fe-S cluster protein YjdI
MAPKVEEVRGTRAVIRFEAAKCIHSRNCVLGRPDVFVPNAEGAWLRPDSASAEAVMRVVESCPSGALTAERLDGGIAEEPPVVNTVRIRENGPLAVHAPMTLLGGPVGLRATLCRCGASRNKPYCDGSHVDAGFTATGEPPTRESQPLPVRNGTIGITPQTNGPLKVEGPLEIVSGTGRTVDRVREAYFCRCGASAHKPYCDGSHRKVGFVAD